MCQAAFFALGAYASAILTTTYQVDPMLALLIGMIFTGLVAYGVGAPVLRLKGYYLAIATLGFGLIIQSLSRHAGPIHGRPGRVQGHRSIKDGGVHF